MRNLDCRLDEELKRLKQARNTNEQRLTEAQGITRTVQAACQVQITHACLLHNWSRHVLHPRFGPPLQA